MDIVERLKEQAVGREEWRVANPGDGSYVISFSWGDTLSPERDAREWLADHLTRNPTSWVAGYEVRKVMAQGDTDMLMIDAASEIARLRDEHASMSAQLIAFQTAWPGGVDEVLSDFGSLREYADECDALRTKLADILTRTANALKGEPGPLMAHSWHDLPECAERTAKDAAKWQEREAKIAGLKSRGFLGSPLRDAAMPKGE